MIPNARLAVLAIGLNLAWSFHPVLGKVLLQGWSPWHVAWLRYTSAWLTWRLILPWLKKRFLTGRNRTREPDLPLSSQALSLQRWIPFLMGGATFCLSPLLLSLGLNRTGASDNALLIALEPLGAVLMAMIVLSERPGRSEFMSLGIAACGVFVLSGGLDRGGQAQAAELIGILMIIASLLGEGFFSVGGRLLVLERAGLGSLATFTRSLTWGVLLLSVIILPVHGAPDWQSFTVSRGLALLWIGPFGTAISYYIWLRLLDSVPVSVLSISLFVQPLAGIAFSCMILGESVGISRLVGGVLILAAMSIQVFGKRVSKIARS